MRLLVCYDGTDFCGWQRQSRPPLTSVQEVIEHALSQIYNQTIVVGASGRTDSGVHALGQVVHFDAPKHKVVKDLCWASRAHLPNTVVIRKVYLAPPEFHATLSAERKTYVYLIYNDPRPHALLARYSFWVRKPLDLDYLNETSKFLLKNQDFSSFKTAGTVVQTTVREVFEAKWTRVSPRVVMFSITGNGFLKQMVRNITGTLVKMFLDERPPEDLKTILAACDRQEAGPTAPPQGLYLKQVYYPSELDKKCLQI